MTGPKNLPPGRCGNIVCNNAAKERWVQCKIHFCPHRTALPAVTSLCTFGFLQSRCNPEPCPICAFVTIRSPSCVLFIPWGSRQPRIAFGTCCPVPHPEMQEECHLCTNTPRARLEQTCDQRSRNCPACPTDRVLNIFAIVEDEKGGDFARQAPWLHVFHNRHLQQSIKPFAGGNAIL